MSILRSLIDEMSAEGSTSAHAIATTPGGLFGGGHIDPVRAKEKQRKMMKRIMQYPEAKDIKIEGYAIVRRADNKKLSGPYKKQERAFNDLNKIDKKSRNQYKVIRESFFLEDIAVGQGETDFDASDVMSKLDAAQKRAKTEDDTTAFGLEDSEGRIIKVYVRSDQADDFEDALGDALHGADEDDDEENSSPEIAEVLYQLKDRFDIVDAEWPEIETDEEQEQEVGGEESMGAEGGEEGMEPEGGEEGEGGEGGEEGMEEMGGGEGGEEGMEDMGGEDEGATSALQQVIDVMKSDAEAKKAEADARTAEARAREAEASAHAASHKVKQEEQVLDMEAYNDNKKEQENETKKLAQLAKYQHDKASDNEAQLSGGYEMSMESADPYKYHDTPAKDAEEITLDELSKFVYDFLRGQR